MKQFPIQLVEGRTQEAQKRLMENERLLETYSKKYNFKPLRDLLGFNRGRQKRLERGEFELDIRFSNGQFVQYPEGCQN